MTTIMKYIKISNRSVIEIALIVVAFIAMSIPVFVHAETLTRQLSIGASGADVTALQTFLAQDPVVYPQGLITGYFGTLTSAAVSNFQAKNGIANVGRVGPITLALINSRMMGGANVSGYAPIITNVTVSAGRNAATVNWNTNELSNGLVYYSSVPLTTYERLNSVDVSGSTAMTDTSYRSAQNVSLSNLQPSTRYYYLIYTTDQQGNVSVTWPTSFATAN